jgi:class 3 adenylate cyclase
VNVAARFADYGRPNEVLVTDDVVRLTRTRAIVFHEIGLVGLKGVPQPVTVKSVGARYDCIVCRSCVRYTERPTGRGRT